MKDHDEVRRVIANRSGRPTGPPTQIDQRKAYPTGH